MKNEYLYLGFISMVAVGLASCNSSGNTTATTSTNNIPTAFQCLPSQLSSTAANNGNSLKIAYAGNCAVANATESVALQSMAASLEVYSNNDSTFLSNCSGTPLQYNSSTGVGFILTAAHCVTGDAKAANTQVTPSNITIYDIGLSGHNSAWIEQGVAAEVPESANLTAQIVAVYIPSQYCQVPSFSLSGGTYACSNITEANGDFAVLKIQTQPSKTLAVSSSIALAPSSLSVSGFSYILGLGYGTVNSTGTIGGDKRNESLNYINYQYFGTNSFAGSTGESVILTGYYSNGYYSIVCRGDSGGGDFVWNGSSWYLLGVHSYISVNTPGCGASSPNYNNVNNASADVRQFNSWIQNILTSDTESTGCASLGDSYVCESGVGK